MRIRFVRRQIQRRKVSCQLIDRCIRDDDAPDLDSTSCVLLAFIEDKATFLAISFSYRATAALARGCLHSGCSLCCSFLWTRSLDAADCAQVHSTIGSIPLSG